MKRISTVILAFTIFISMKTYAQEKSFTLDDLIPGGYSNAKLEQKRSARPVYMRWYGDDLTFVEGNTLKKISNKGKKKDIIKLDELNQKSGLDLKSIYNITELYGEISSALIKSDSSYYLFNLATKNLDGSYELDSKSQNADFNSQNKMLAYTTGDNLFIQTKEGLKTNISNDETANIVYGHAVHQFEFGISKGAFWSPKGNYLAFYRMDESMVTDYPLVDATTRIASLKSRKYPMAGMKSHHVTLGVYDVENGTTTYLNTGGPEEKYLTNISWSPDEKLIYIAELNRGQDTCVVRSYDALTGELHKELFTETHDKYVEPQNPLLFLKNDESKFIWQSRRNGYNHAYLYSTDGEELKQITNGKWDISSILGFDDKGEKLFYISTEESPIEQHIYAISLKNAKKEKISKEKGVHAAQLSLSGKYAYDAYTSQKNPGEVAYVETRNGKSNVIHKGMNPYTEAKMPEINLGKIKADDGETDLYYRLTKPVNFDSKKKYPTIVYVYGGPHSQLVANSWRGQASGWEIYMAQLGYVVFTMDNRGTQNRGFDFENITHRQLGVVESIDQMSGVDFLRTLPYVDQDRIGVHGWSFGGFMTMSLMLRYPDVFKVGVAGGPVTDWSMYEIMYGERYMDHPEENPEGYKFTSVLNKVNNLAGRLLIIHGDIDPVVVPQHSMRFLQEAVKHNKYPDFFLYTGHEHNVLGHERVHLHEKITRYFEDFLR